ncbi:hypothetical protein [Luteibacter sp. 9135]|uniref:hypothetical protein n=1 Tax=Luteibacter sp. 9135 TaxID=1500893 RepID=UPI00056655AA|nr:hypothetical protein [Luteibacter sp. 9135]
MKRRLHAIAAVLAFALVATFWTSTLVSELFLSKSAVVTVKAGIAYALFLFLPAMATTAATGFSMAGKATHALLARKRKRMPWIAGTGLLVLLPAALFLHLKASAGDFGPAFVAVQLAELFAGASNLVLIGLNIRDGFAFARLKQKRVTKAPSSH